MNLAWDTLSGSEDRVARQALERMTHGHSGIGRLKNNSLEKRSGEGDVDSRILVGGEFGRSWAELEKCGQHSGGSDISEDVIAQTAVTNT